MRATIVFITIALVSTTAVAADWRAVWPHVTTESELISAFGAPNQVTSVYLWSEWSAKWKKRPNASHYTLRYETTSDSALLVGPGGKADSVEVGVADSKIIGVTWHYGGPSAKAAAITLRADRVMTFGPAKVVSTAGGGKVGQSIYVQVGPDDSEVTVSLSLK
jgi:hypothetical protein